MPRSRPLVLLLAAAAATVGGCARGDAHENRPRPPAPITVTAAVSDGRIAVSPRRFGAGPVVLIVSNQSRRSHAVTLETEEIGGRRSGLTQTTSPIEPGATATLSLVVRRGTYALRTRDRRLRPVALRVGPRRASAQDELMLP